MIDHNPTLNVAVASHVHDALVCLQKAELAMINDVQPNHQAVIHELVTAATSLGRVLNLVGGR